MRQPFRCEQCTPASVDEALRPILRKIRRHILCQSLRVLVFSLSGALVATAMASDPACEPTSDSRTFTLECQVELTDLAANQPVRVWVPLPQSTAFQDVTRLRHNFPAEFSIATEPGHGNSILYFTTTADARGKLSFSSTYLITRREIARKLAELDEPVLSQDKRAFFLQPNRMVPVGGKPLELIKPILAKLNPQPKTEIELARVIYDRVLDHMAYDKTRPGYGRGDANWACESGFGNCSDFHSLFIAIARGLGIPARFEIGLPIPEGQSEGTISGYHCWAFFHSEGRGWIPVDISEADKSPDRTDYYFGSLTASRVAFTTGRDLELIPKQAGEKLNFLIHPYVEINGKPLSAKSIHTAYSFKDQ